jgi:hypothetical protein
MMTSPTSVAKSSTWTSVSAAGRRSKQVIHRTKYHGHQEEWAEQTDGEVGLSEIDEMADLRPLETARAREGRSVEHTNTPEGNN